MKKFIRSFIPVTILMVLFGSLIYTSCKLSIEDDTTAVTPDAASIGKTINLTIKKYDSGVSYINVYREDTTSGSGSVNIGVIYPAAFNNQVAIYFKDSLVTKNHVYKYKVRYNMDGNFVYSNWTGGIKAEDGYDSTDKLTFFGDNNFSFNSSSGVLRQTNNTNFVNYTDTILSYSTVLGIRSDAGSKLISVTRSNDTPPAAPADGKFNPDDVSLTQNLPSALLNTPLEVVGLIGQLEEKDGSVVKIVHWTEPFPIKIDGSTNKKITVKAGTNSTGHDYSRSVNVIIQ